MEFKEAICKKRTEENRGNYYMTDRRKLAVKMKEAAANFNPESSLKDSSTFFQIFFFFLWRVSNFTVFFVCFFFFFLENDATKEFGRLNQLA